MKENPYLKKYRLINIERMAECKNHHSVLSSVTSDSDKDCKWDSNAIA